MMKAYVLQGLRKIVQPSNKNFGDNGRRAEVMTWAHERHPRLTTSTSGGGGGVSSLLWSLTASKLS